MSQHHNIGLIMNTSNTHHKFATVKIVSFTTEESDSEIKVSELVAGIKCGAAVCASFCVNGKSRPTAEDEAA